MSCSRAEAGVKGGQAVVVTVQTEFGGDADGELGGGTYIGGEGEDTDGMETEMD